MDALSSVFNVVSTLHPALALAHSLFEECRKVSVNKNQCIGVGDRAAAILKTLDERLKSARDEGGPGLSKDIEVLEGQFLYVRNKMAEVAQWNFFKALLRSSEISQAVQASHRRLNDVCQGFLIVSVLNVQYNQQAAEEARQQDAQALKGLMAQAAYRDAALIRMFDIGQKQEMEAMRAMQKALANQIESVEHKMMKAGLAALQRMTGKAAPKQLPPWHINVYDIDVDETSQLGEGGFGVVKKATWIGRTVAVKRLISGTSQKMLSTEIAVWSRLRHEHILQFFGASETADPPFIVSCYMKNGNVREYVSVHPSCNRALLLHHVTLGMAYLHQHKVIHGDLKGPNILVDDAGKACIADFGLAKITRELQSRTSTIVGDMKKDMAGTLRFMAPEQMKGKLLPASDVYSFGMLMYQLYTDEVPFMLVPDNLLLQVVSQERLEWPEDEDAVAFGLTPEIWDVLMECSDPMYAKRPTFDQLHYTMGLLSESAQSRVPEVEVLINEARFLSIDSQTRTKVPEVEAHTKQARSWNLDSMMKTVVPQDKLTTSVQNISAPAPYSKSGAPDALRKKDPSLSVDQQTKTLVPNPHLETVPDTSAPAKHSIPGRQTLLRGRIESVVFSSDGVRVASFSWGGMVRVWATSTGALLRELKLNDPGRGASERAVPTGSGLAISTDAGFVVFCSAYSNIIDFHAWKGDSSTSLLLYAQGWIQCMVVSPDGSRVAAASSKHLELWEVRDGRIAHHRTLMSTPSSSSVPCLAFSADGKRLLSGNFPQEGDMSLWEELATGTLHRRKHFDHLISRNPVFTADGTRLMFAKPDGVIHVQDVSTLEAVGKPLSFWQKKNESESLVRTTLAVSRDGRSVAIGYVIWTYPNHGLPDNGVFSSLKMIVNTYRLGIWDTESGEMLLPLVEFPSSLRSLDFSADGKRLAVGTDDGLELLELDLH